MASPIVVAGAEGPACPHYVPVNITARSHAAIFNLLPESPVVSKWHRIFHTHVNEDKFCVTFSIPNFSSYKSGCLNLASPDFSAGPDAVSWRLFIYTERDSNTRCKRVGGYISLSLDGFFDPNLYLETLKNYKVDFSLLDAKNEKVNLKRGCRRSDLNFVFGHKLVSVETPSFIQRNSLLNPKNGFLLKGKLTILCEVTVSTERNQRIDPREPSCELRMLPEDFAFLLENQESSDFTISVGGRELLVHRAILAAHSPVFAAMLNDKMKENEQNILVITDIDYKVLKEIMMYIYTGRSLLELQPQMAQDLLVASDKYCLCELKRECECVLSLRLTVENAPHLFAFADMYSAETLKCITFGFIISFCSEVIKTSAWEKMILTHPHLVAEAFEAIVSLL